MKFFTLFFSAFLFAFSHSAFAQGFSRGTVVVYGNGMFNADGEWDRGSEVLEQLFINDNIDLQGKVEYKVAINRSEYKVNGLSVRGLDEFYQVASQKLGELTVRQRFWLWLSRNQPFPSELTEDYIRISAAVSANTISVDSEVQSHIGQYRSYFAQGKRVLLVSHSQGNLIANLAWRSIFGNGLNSQFVDSFGNVQVATPALAVSAGSRGSLQPFGTWNTFPDDKIISNVRSAIGALPANLPAEGLIGDPALGHNFVSAYMRIGSTSRSRIVEDMIAVAKALRYPDGIFDLAPAENDAEGLSSLIDDSNNKDPELAVAGKILYLEGVGLGGAKYAVPGFSGRLTPSPVNLPTDHPLFLQGAEVWKLGIPNDATAGATGKITAYITVDGQEQRYESPRSIKISRGGSQLLRFTQGKTGSAGLPLLYPDFVFQPYYISLYWVYVLEYFSGPDAGKKYRLADVDRPWGTGCTYCGGNPGSITVTGQSNTEAAFLVDNLSEANFVGLIPSYFQENTTSDSNVYPAAVRARIGNLEVRNYPDNCGEVIPSLWHFEEYSSFFPQCPQVFDPDRGYYFPCAPSWSPETLNTGSYFSADRKLRGESCSTFDAIKTRIKAEGSLR
jgi:hypothetical protein